MKTEDDRIGKTELLRATISIITRGGPITVNTYQDTNPVLLKGMQLPAEARYSFKDPTDHSSNFVNHPISVESFFGENGKEEFDISLGNFQLQEFPPRFTSFRNIELRLAVSRAQILSITLIDPIPQKCRSIGFIDISALDPPVIKPMPKIDASENLKKTYQSLLEMVENPQPRQTGNPRRGEDLAQDVTISFDEALHGGSKDIKVVGTETCPACTGSGTVLGRALSSCPDCMGTGWAREMKETSKGPQYRFTVCTTCKGDGLVNVYPCHTCRGNGWVRIKRSFTLQIPAYIDSGAVICILHQGKPGRYGGFPGHLRICAHVARHPLFVRAGRDVTIRLPVSTSFAKEGGYLRVPDVKKGSPFLLKVPAGVKSDTTFQVFESEDYSLTAQIEFYRPPFLFALPNVRKRLQATKELLGCADYELPAHLGNVTVDQTPVVDELIQNGKTRGKMTQTVAGSTLAMGHPPNQAEFYTQRGMVYAEKGKQERALADYNKALELDSVYASAYDKRSVLYLYQKEHGKALADLNKALELEPNNAGYYYHRGMLYHLQENSAMALADYDKALDLDPTNAAVYESRGRLCALQDDLEAALADFSKVLKLDPNNAEAYCRRGVLYQRKNDSANALADFNRALELDPKNDSILSDRGHVYLLQNDLERALADISRVVERNPSNARAYNNRGYVYFLQNSLDRALADYDKALDLDPELVAAHNYRGQVNLKQARYQEALDDFRKSLSLHPGDMYIHQWLGLAYQGLGETDKAIASYREVLENSPNPELCRETQELLDNLGGK